MIGFLFDLITGSWRDIFSSIVIIWGVIVVESRMRVVGMGMVLLMMLLLTVEGPSFIGFDWGPAISVSEC